MTKLSKTTMAATAFAAVLMGSAAFAGALLVEVGNPEANPEATRVNAVLVARVTACHEPAKSTVTASSVQMVNGEIRRTPLTVTALKTPGTFAIIGSVARGSAIDVAVTNPEYKNYQPRVLVRTDANGIQWASVKRFFSVPPTDTDMRSMLGAVD